MSNEKDLITKLKATKERLIKTKSILNKKDNHIYPIAKTPFNIPNNWEWIYLSDISLIHEGPGIRKHQYQDEGVQFLTVTNILEGSIDLLKSQKYISFEEYEEKYKHFTINKGDIVTACSGASWGKSAIFNEEELLILNTSTLRLRFFDDLGENKYLYYYTKSNFFKSNLASYSTGQQANYGYSHYSRIPIPIPPLAEQKQIVAILDQAFETIDQAKANIEKNIVNAKELFQSKLNEIFSQKGEGWKEKSIDEVSSVLNGYSFKSTDFSVDNDVKAIKITNVGVKEFIEESSNNLPKSFSYEYSRVQVSEGDIVIALTRTIISNGLKVAKVPKTYDKALLNQRVAAIAPKKNIINTNFLYYYFSSDIVYNYVLENVNMLMQPNLSINDLKKMKVPMTSIELQNEISIQIENLIDCINFLVNKYSNKLSSLDELKKSILEKAFSGELTNESTMA